MSLLAPRNCVASECRGFVGGATDGADQVGGALHHCFQVFPDEALMQVHDGCRVGKAEQLLRCAQVGLHDAFDQACYALPDVGRAAFGGLG